MRKLASLLLPVAALTACQDLPTASTAAPLPSAASANAGTANVGAADDADPRYIVVFDRNVADAPGLTRNLERQHGFAARYRYSAALKGFAAPLPEAARTALARNPNVEYIVEDADAEVIGSGSTLLTASQWGLDRIDQRALTRDNSYGWEADGAGVEAYILDTGIRYSHQEFGGRAVSFYDYVDNDPIAEECQGHGTHVAGTVGGSTVGVARQVTLLGVRVLGCSGSGAYSGIIAAIDSITKRKLANPSIPMVGNMSLGGSGVFQPIITAVDNSVGAGVVWAIAAGNSNMDACSFSPAAATSALTVGATASNDSRSSFSNFGPCVDVFAPGSSIYSSTMNGDNTYASWNGTSMATPHVAGVAALYLSANPTASAYTVNAVISGDATPNVVTGAGTGSPNRLLYSRIATSGVTPVPGGTHVLTVGLNGNGGLGTVTATGISCTNSGGDCSEAYTAGSTVTLTATPGANSGFGGWTGPCTVSGTSCTVSMTNARSVMATFNLPVVSVTRAGTSLGTVTSSPAGINCGSDCSEAYAFGTTVTLTATPAAGGAFTGWSGACTGSGATCTLSANVYGTRGVTASFTTLQTLTVTTSGTGSGAVTSNPAGINCGTTCAAGFSNGALVTLTAVPASGSAFAGWTGACTGTGACTVTMDAAKSVSAAFTAVATQPLTVTVTGNGRVTSSPAGIDCGAHCTENVSQGSAVTLTATPDAGQRFVGWAGACTGTTNSCTVTVSAATTVQAAFEPIPALPTMFVGSLLGSRTVGSRSWSASATVYMQTDAGAPVAGATVTVLTSGATTATLTCVTGADGRCSVRRDNLKSSRTSITFTVSNATASGATYNAARNVQSAVTVTR